MKLSITMAFAAALLACTLGCPRSTTQTPSNGAVPAVEECVVTQRVETEEALSLLGRQAWVYGYRGGIVDVKLQIYRKIVDEPTFAGLIAPENLVHEQVGTESRQMVFASQLFDDDGSEIADSQF